MIILVSGGEVDPFARTREGSEVEPAKVSRRGKAGPLSSTDEDPQTRLNVSVTGKPAFPIDRNAVC